MKSLLEHLRLKHLSFAVFANRRKAGLDFLAGHRALS